MSCAYTVMKEFSIEILKLFLTFSNNEAEKNPQVHKFVPCVCLNYSEKRLAAGMLYSRQREPAGKAA